MPDEEKASKINAKASYVSATQRTQEAMWIVFIEHPALVHFNHFISVGWRFAPTFVLYIKFRAATVKELFTYSKLRRRSQVISPVPIPPSSNAPGTGTGWARILTLSIPMVRTPAYSADAPKTKL